MHLIETLLWYIGNIFEYVLQMLPCMLAASLAYLCLRPARLRRLERLGLTSGPWREGALLLFLMFVAGLASLTLFPAYFWNWAHWSAAFGGERPLFPPVDLEMQLQSLQLTPFQEVRRAFRGPWVMFLMLANIGIFFPLGFFSALLWQKSRWWKAVLTGFCTSVTIEFVQFFIGRSTDIDDVILNTTGTLVGYWLFLLFKALFPRFSLKFRCHKREDVQNGSFDGNTSPAP